MKLSAMKLSAMKLSAMKLSAMKLSAMKLSAMKLSAMKLSAMKPSATKSGAMKAFATAMTIAFLATPAYAQSLNLSGPTNKVVTQEDVKAQEDRDNAYKSAISKLPAQKPVSDPWGNVRGTGAAQNNQNGARPGSK